MQPQSDNNSVNTSNTPNTDHLTVAGLEFEDSAAKELENAFTSELSNTPKNTPTNQGGFDEKVNKIEKLQESLAKEGDALKSDIESKIQQLKNLKKTIEDELHELKSLEQKKTVYDNELKKIKDLESAQKNVEDEINSLISSN